MAIIFEVRVRLHASDAGQADLIKCILINAGVPAGQIIEQYQSGRCMISFYEHSRGRAHDRARRIRSAKLKGVSVAVARIQDLDWASRWKKYFKPFNISPDIRVVPLWMKNAKVPAGSMPVYLDTTFAFGSGLHATTRMMARFLFTHKAYLRRFLDIGTGSGLLALIGNAYGCREVYAIDIDPVAVKTAAANCRLNRCAFAYLKAVSFEDLHLRCQFEFVAANLLTEDLMRLQKKLIAAVAPGGYLAVSGIFHENYPAFARRFASRTLGCVAVTREKGWYAVLYKKSSRQRSPTARTRQVSVE